MSVPARQFWADQRGGPAAEFAMVLPILVLFLLGLIDVGRLMWTWNQAEQATQAGARFAVATDPIPGGSAPNGMKNYSYATTNQVPQGDPVGESLFGGVTCTSTACSCKGSNGGTCPFLVTLDSTIFQRVVDRMALFKPDIAANKVQIDYDWSGLGFSGDPNGADVSPLITVKLLNMTFRPLVLFGASVTLPPFSATLSMEDGDGTTSN